jgi:hypothetical protein
MEVEREKTFLAILIDIEFEKSKQGLPLDEKFLKKCRKKAFKEEMPFLFSSFMWKGLKGTR